MERDASLGELPASTDFKGQGGLMKNPLCVTIRAFSKKGKRYFQVTFKSRIILLAATLMFSLPLAVSAQADASKPNVTSNGLTGEGLAETVIIVYAGFAPRERLNEVRKTTAERGKVTLQGPGGKDETITYERFIIRAEKFADEKMRLNQNFPNAKFALVYDGTKHFGIYNDSMFVPREDAITAFKSYNLRGLESLLRYKENGLTPSIAGEERLMGVDYNLLDLADASGNKTRFYVSKKSLRVMMLEYEENGVRFQRRFYDYNYQQGMLVPFRTVLFANGKQVEEIRIQTITFGQKVDEALFQQV